MITLDAVQLFALRKSASEPIQVAGLNGAGKSTLANAIATQSARDGRSCLLIGRDASLDRPIAFQTLEQVHQVLANRAKLNNQTDVLSPKVRTKMVLPSELIDARAKTDPVAAKTAVRLLRRTRELTGQYKLNADEIEESIANQSIAPEAFDLASLAVQDASRLADELWSGNGRAGRSFHDLKGLLGGAAIEVPANEQILKLILAAMPLSRPQSSKSSSIAANRKKSRLSPRCSVASDGPVLRTRPWPSAISMPSGCLE